MRYIHFPNEAMKNIKPFPEWFKHANEYKISDEKWKELVYWLANHVALQCQLPLAVSNSDTRKCWYSEKPISGLGEKDVDHFRPKQKTDIGNSTQLQTLEDILGTKPSNLAISGHESGYDWLAYDYKNYRLSSPHSNRSTKNARFPLLMNTKALQHSANSTAQNPNQDPTKHKEYPLLLDPANKEVEGVFMVDAEGVISCIFDKPDSAFFNTLLQNPDQNWEDKKTIWLRAQFSLVIYDLNHTDLQRDRAGKYAECTQEIENLNEAIASNNTMAIKHAVFNLEKMTKVSAVYSLAACSAIWHYNTTNTTLKQKLRDILLKAKAPLFVYKDIA